MIRSGFPKYHNILFTGKMSITRDEMERIAKDAGAYVQKSVTYNTDVLIIGDRPGSKLQKAKNIGITVISEKEFMDRIRLLDPTPEETETPKEPEVEIDLDELAAEGFGAW